MPPSATSNSPWRSSVALVNEPRLWPNSSLVEQLGRDGAAILADERLVAARAVVVQGARQQLLAGAGLAGDENRRVTRHHPLDEIECAAQGGTVADDLVEAIAPLRLAPEMGVLDPQPLVGALQLILQPDVVDCQPVDLRPLAYGADQLFHDPRLGEVAEHPTGIDRVDEGFDVGVAGENDAHQIRVRLDGAPDQLGAGHPRHALVDDRDRDVRMLREDVQGRLPTGRRKDLELLPEADAQKLDARRLVVDDQDGWPRRWRPKCVLTGTGHGFLHRRFGRRCQRKRNFPRSPLGLARRSIIPGGSRPGGSKPTRRRPRRGLQPEGIHPSPRRPRERLPARDPGPPRANWS